MQSIKRELCVVLPIGVDPCLHLVVLIGAAPGMMLLRWVWLQVIQVVSRIVAVAAIGKFIMNTCGMGLSMARGTRSGGSMLTGMTINTGCGVVFGFGRLELVESGTVTGRAQIIGGRCRVLQQGRLMCSVTGGAVGYGHFGRM